jgi:hypothetical protein
MYDLIGDIHGHAAALQRLLKTLGYSRHKGVYRHPERQAIFLGDFIDHGPKSRETLELAEFATGSMNLDRLTKAYIHERLEYQFAIVRSSSEAFALEKQCREGLVFGTKPLLNPA